MASLTYPPRLFKPLISRLHSFKTVFGRAFRYTNATCKILDQQDSPEDPSQALVRSKSLGGTNFKPSYSIRGSSRCKLRTVSLSLHGPLSLKQLQYSQSPSRTVWQITPNCSTLAGAPFCASTWDSRHKDKVTRLSFAFRPTAC